MRIITHRMNGPNWKTKTCCCVSCGRDVEVGRNVKKVHAICEQCRIPDKNDELTFVPTIGFWNNYGDDDETN